jgi:hypothetical protein
METEFAYRIAHFTDQANANVRADNPGRTDAELAADGLFFDDDDMYRANVTCYGDFYVGTEDATIWGIKYGKTYQHRLEYETHVDQFVDNAERWSVDLYRFTLRDTGATVWAVERIDDSDTTVRFFGYEEDAYAAFDEETGKEGGSRE